jgi:hypothetical protein
MGEVVEAIEAAAPESRGTITYGETALALPEEFEAQPLVELIGSLPYTPLRQAVGETIALFRERVAAGQMAPDAMLK